MSSMYKNNVYVIQRDNHGLDVDHKVRVQSLSIGCNDNPTLLRDGTYIEASRFLNATILAAYARPYKQYLSS